MPKSYAIEQILKQPLFEALSDLCGALERAGGLETPGALNGAETAFLAAFNCWGSIESEGLNGWLFNISDPVVFTQAVEAFRAVGASQQADALWRVARLFPGAKLPSDPDAFSEIVLDDQHGELYEEIENELRDGDVGELLCRYVVEHIEQFR